MPGVEVNDGADEQAGHNPDYALEPYGWLCQLQPGCPAGLIMSDNHELTAKINGSPTLFSFNESSFVVGSLSKPKHTTSLYNVVWAQCTENTLELDFAVRKGEDSPLQLIHESAQVDDEVTAVEWTEKLMAAAYKGVKPQRKLKVLVNPRAGPGKAPTTFTQIVEPILKAARCTIDVTYTDHSKHAQEIARQLPLDFDAVVILSGDGLTHEVFNGFAEHSDPISAFDIPIAPIPSGSANGTCLNLLGYKDGFDVCVASLNAIKGRPMRVDLCSFTQKDRRNFSYMSQTTGLMADLDIGTEHLRWMGDARFVYGYIRGGLFNRKPCPISVSVKITERDKHKMLDHWRTAYQASGLNNSGEELPSLAAPRETPLPPLKYSSTETEGWTDLDLKPLLFLFAGMAPYAGRAVMQWPLSLPADGEIDLVLQEMESRTKLITSLSGAELGTSFWKPSLHYIKCKAYRVKPHAGGTGVLSIDGEEFPFEEFQVEVHQGMAAFLSPFGRYAAEFDVPPPSA